jgi:Zn-dependent protease with chaperone function
MLTDELNVIAELRSTATRLIGDGDIAGAKRLLDYIEPIQTWTGSDKSLPPPMEWEMAHTELGIPYTPAEAPPEPVGTSTSPDWISSASQEDISPPPPQAAELTSPEWISGEKTSPRMVVTGKLDTKRLKRFQGISPKAFQHPWDLQATEALKKIPFLDTLLKFAMSNWSERQSQVYHHSHCIKIGPKQGPSLYKKMEEAMVILDLPYRPDIFIHPSPVVNAYASGVKRFHVVLTCGLIDALSEAELMAVVAHELGHIKCNHMLYGALARLLTRGGLSFLNSMLPMGLGNIAGITAGLAIMDWYRKAEFSCDRAALLVVQEPEIVASALAKIAGGSSKAIPELNLDAILEQAQDFEDMGDSLPAKIFHLNSMIEATHPYPILRVREILNWGDSTQFHRIMEGDYPREQRADKLRFADPVGLRCNECQSINSVTALFCFKCGRSTSDAQRVCGSCQQPVQANWQRCANCGEALTPATVQS